VGRRLSDGNRLTGEERFVNREIRGRHDHRVGGNPVTFLEQEEVVADDVASRNAALLSVADHQRPGAGQVPQLIEGTLRLVLLVQRDPRDQEDEAEEHQGLVRIAQDDVDRTARDEQEEHRLAQHFTGNRQEAAVSGGRQIVVALDAQPFGGGNLR
jgi:hypothetical protein